MASGARFYDPLVGRFTSPDPIKDVSSANVVNPYVYWSNNPLRYTDKFGLSKMGDRPRTGVGDEGSGGSAGGYYGTHFGWDEYDPIPFSAYPSYYGASVNGRQAWIYRNEVKFRAKQEAKEAMLEYQIASYEAAMAASNAFVEYTKYRNMCADMIEMLSTYNVGMAGVGGLMAGYDAAMAANEGGFVADVSAVSAGGAEGMGSAFEGGGTGGGTVKGGDDPSFWHALGQAFIGTQKVMAGGTILTVTGYVVIWTRGRVLVGGPGGLAVRIIGEYSIGLIYDGAVNDYIGSVPEAVAAATNYLRGLASQPPRVRSGLQPQLNPYGLNWPDYDAEIRLEERWPK